MSWLCAALTSACVCVSVHAHGLPCQSHTATLSSVNSSSRISSTFFNVLTNVFSWLHGSTFVWPWLLPSRLLSASQFKPLNRPHERDDISPEPELLQEPEHIPLPSQWVLVLFWACRPAPCFLSDKCKSLAEHRSLPIFNSVKGVCFCPRLQVPFIHILVFWFSRI